MQAKNNKKQKSMTAISSAIDCMPKEKSVQRILHERAELIAKILIDDAQKTDIENYIGFALGPTEKYGIDYRFIKEVVDNIVITRLPCAPHYIAGIINRRGSLLAIVDLKQLFFSQSETCPTNASIIIASSKNVSIGILVDKIEGNFNYDPKLLETTLTSENIAKREYILGLNQGITAIINIEAIINDLQPTTSDNHKISQGASP